MGLDKPVSHNEKPKKTRKLEKQQKRAITLDVQKIEPKKMQEINTGDHAISREIIALTIEQKKTLKTRINTAQAKIEAKKDSIKDGVVRVKQSVRAKKQELISRVDEFADNIVSLIELGNIDPTSKDVQQAEIDDILQQADEIQLPKILKRFIATRQGDATKGINVIKMIENRMNKNKIAKNNAQDDIDYGLGDRPVAKKQDEEIYRGLDERTLNDEGENIQ